MDDYHYSEDPIHVLIDGVIVKCCPYPPKDRKIMENDKRISSKYVLKEIFEKFGVIVNPNAMTYWYKY